MRRLVVAVLLVGLVAGVSPGAAAPSDTTSTSDATRATLVGVYPNPAADSDRGEFVLVSLPRGAPTSANYTLGDDEGRVSITSARTGLVAFSTAPNATRELVEWPVESLPGGLQLSNAGEPLVLRRGAEALDTLSYTDAPEGELRRDGVWRPLGTTDVDPLTVEDVQVRSFVLPDAPAEPLAALRSADERLLLSGYTFTSRRATDALLAAHARGVDVRVLVEGGPVGGVTVRERDALDRLADAGVDVTVLDGPRARYAFHHAQYRYLPVHFYSVLPYLIL